MPLAWMSNEWLFGIASRLMPTAASASIDSGGEAKRPSRVLCPASGSNTAASKLVKLTSPSSSARIAGMLCGASARVSPRIID